eukprot:g757.t1 g757   contig10:673194-673569(+)
MLDKAKAEMKQMQKDIEEEAESGYIRKRDEGYGGKKRRNINQPITDGRSLGIDIPSHVSTGGGQSVTSPLPSMPTLLLMTLPLETQTTTTTVKAFKPTS